MYMADGTVVQIRTRPAFVHMRCHLNGKVMSLAILGESTLETVRVLMNENLAKRLIDKIAATKRAGKPKRRKASVSKSVVDLPEIVVAGLKVAIRDGQALIPFPSGGYEGFLDDPSLAPAAPIIKGVLGGRGVRVHVSISDDVVLAVRQVMWPKASRSKPTAARRPVSKTAN